MDKEATCAERVEEHWQGRREELKVMFRECNGDALNDEQRAALAKLGHDEADQYEPLLYEYGLCFDRVDGDASTPGYFRYVLSTGGPGDEIRFYVGWGGGLLIAEYWFRDWFDGASINVTHEPVIQALYDWLEAGDAFKLAESLTAEDSRKLG